MSRGLGKLERWIIVAAYAKTIKHQLPEGWRLPAGWEAMQRQAPENGGWIHGLDAWNENLSRTEVMLNFFDLPTSDRRKSQELWHQCFKDTPAYRAALASLSRTLLGLHLKHLIEWTTCFNSSRSWIQWDGLRLTETGIAAAEKLSANSCGPISSR